jgi:hypothetical protein
MQNMMRGRTNTKVLPLPVNAIPIMSRPDSLSQNINILTRHTVITYNVLHALPHTTHLAKDLCKTNINIGILVTSCNTVWLVTQPEFGQAIRTFHEKYRQTDSLLFDCFSDHSTKLTIYGSKALCMPLRHMEGSTGIAPLIPNLRTKWRWMVSLMPQTSRTDPPIPIS